MSIVALAALLCVVLTCVGANNLPIDCSQSQENYTTSVAILTSPSQPFNLSTYLGTSLYVDCFVYVLDILSTAYYYNSSRYVQFQMIAQSLPVGCVAYVKYSFSAFTSRMASQFTKSSPFLVAADPSVLLRAATSTVALQASRYIDSVQFLTGYQFAAVGYSRWGFSCSRASSNQGTLVLQQSTETVGDGSANRSAIRLLWTYPYPQSNYYMLCVKEPGASKFYYSGLLDVYDSNPAFFLVSRDDPGNASVALGMQSALTFVGQNFDLRQGKDTARLVSTRSRCDKGADAGGVPRATNLQPANAYGINVTRAVWNFTLMIQGSYQVCYFVSATSTWVSVPRYSYASANTQSLVPDPYGAITDGSMTAAPTPTSSTITNVPTTLAPLGQNTTTSPSPSGRPTTTTTATPSGQTTRAPVTRPTTTTTRRPQTSTTMAPVTTTTAAPSCVTLPLPDSCDLLSDPTNQNTLQLILTVGYPQGGLPAEWRSTLATLVCAPLSSVAIYEQADDPSKPGTSSLVLGFACQPLSECDSDVLVSLLYCFSNNLAVANDSTSFAEYSQFSKLLQSKLKVTAAVTVTASIISANTTDHAAPSDNLSLSKKEVVVLSTTITLAVCGVVATVVGIIVFYRRKQIREQFLAMQNRFLDAMAPDVEMVRPASIPPTSDEVLRGVVLEHGLQRGPPQRLGYLPRESSLFAIPSHAEQAPFDGNTTAQELFSVGNHSEKNESDDDDKNEGSLIYDGSVQHSGVALTISHTPVETFVPGDDGDDDN